MAVSGETIETRSYVNGAGGGWAPWAAVDWLLDEGGEDGEGGPRSYRIQARSDPNPVELQDIRLIAMPISGAESLIGATGDAQHKLESMTWADLTSVCTPEGGHYLALANASATEVDPTGSSSETGGSTVNLRMSTAEEAWPVPAFQQARFPFRSFFAAREIGGGQRLRLQAKTPGMGLVTIRDPRIVLISTEHLAGFDSFIDTDDVTTMGPRSVASLTTSAPGARAHHLTIQGTWAHLDDHPDGRSESTHIFTRNGVERVVMDLYHENGFDSFVASHFDVVTTDMAFTLDNTVTTPAPASDPAVVATESFIFVLR